MRFCVCPLKGRRCSLVGHMYSMLLYRHRVSTEFWDSSEVKAILRPSCPVLCRHYIPPQFPPSHTQSRDLYVGLTGNPDSWDISKTNMNDPQGRISSDRRWMDGQTDGFTDPPQLEKVLCHQHSTPCWSAVGLYDCGCLESNLSPYQALVYPNGL